MSMIDRVAADIENTTSIEELDEAILMIEGRKLELKRLELLETIKSVYIGCWIKWKVNETEHIGQVERINRDYARAIENDKPYMAYFRQIIEASDTPFETKRKRTKKETPIETPEIIPEPEIA